MAIVDTRYCRRIHWAHPDDTRRHVHLDILALDLVHETHIQCLRPM
jgi:hypothetical protein